MVQPPVYLDNHATTRVDPRVLEAMLPYFLTTFGNAGSSSHVFGWDAKDAVDRARELVARRLGGTAREWVFTSGATESNNLALKGAAERQRRRGMHLVTLATEHKSVLDPCSRLARRGWELTCLPVIPQAELQVGLVDLDRLAATLRDDTVLVSVMLANNEIGVIQPIAAIAELCHRRGVWLHVDATQAVGKIPVDVEQLQADLVSFSAHKIYGPKGVGALYVRRKAPHIRLEPLLDGGGQEGGVRSGTVNVPGIVGLANALELCVTEMDDERRRLQQLRDRLYAGLCRSVTGVQLNGPRLDGECLRLEGNLNVSFGDVDGEALMMSMREVAVSSGSACTSTNPEPSHVLRALGLSDDQTRASLRFGLGRFNTEAEIDFAIQAVSEAVHRLRGMSRS